MSLLLRGKTVCHLCQVVITATDDAAQFPPGLFDPQSAVEHLNDSSVHAMCLRELPDADFVEVRLNDFIHGREEGQRHRRFTAVVVSSERTQQERVTILATSRYEALALLRDNYGTDCHFDITDVEAATRWR